MLYLHGIGHFHPDTVIDNSFLCSLDIGVDPDWIDERVGIRERRTTLPLDYIRHTRNGDTRATAEASTTSTVAMAQKAAELAILRAGIEPRAIKTVIAGGCSPEMLIPAEAARVAAALQIDAVAFDVSAACASFVAQVHVIAQMRSEALPDFVLVVNVEALTRSTNYSDRKTAVLFGDGASAAILSPRVPASTCVGRSVFLTDPAGHKQVIIPAGGHFDQDGQGVQAFAVRKTEEVFRQTRSTNSNDAGAREIFIGHQANLRMLETVCRRLDIAQENHLSNVRDFGNCGAAGAPSVLSQHWDSLGTSAINLAVVGSGLSWGGIRICKNASALS